jgi:hypothetical protein
MFNERYGLTQSVLEGKKTMTRRIINGNFENVKVYYASGGWRHFVAGTDKGGSVELKPQYEIDEMVAIAQPYKNDGVLTYNAYNEDGTAREDGLQRHKEMLESKGYRNKMFVKAEYMPHRIRITGIKVERLQDISDEEAMREGIEKWIDCYIVSGIMENQGKNNVCFDSPREAFAALIDRISGRGTWQRNPWVYAYTFELIK